MRKLTMMLLIFVVANFSFSESNSALSDKHPEFAALVENGYLVPGLDQGYVPQGLTYFSDRDWLLVSLYDGRHQGRPSVLAAMEAKTGRPVKFLSLEEPNGASHTGHVGGIAVSRNHLWIASSKVVYRFSLAELRKVDDVIRAEAGLKLDSRASYIVVQNDWIWVGEFAHWPTISTAKHHHMKDRKGVRKLAWLAGYRFDLQTGELLSTDPTAVISTSTTVGLHKSGGSWPRFR